MAVRPDVGSAEKHVQESMWIVIRAGMEIVVHAAARRSRCEIGYGVKECPGDQLYVSHVESLSFVWRLGWIANKVASCS